MHRLSNDENTLVRSAVAESIGTSFQYIENKEKAWEDLYRLANGILSKRKAKYEIRYL